MANFNARADCLVKQYSSFVVDGTHVNGERTLGENLGELGGFSMAWSWFANNEQTIRNAAPRIRGLNNDQLFWVYAAQSLCARLTPRAMQQMLAVDSHAPPHLRIDGTLMNVPGFAHTFGCSAATRMGRSLTDARCEVW